MFEDEHHGPTVPESIPELGFRLHWFALGLLALIGCGGNTAWATATLGAMSLIGLALVIANHEIYEGPLKMLALRTAGWLLPVWVLLFTFLAGLAFPAFTVQTIDKEKFWQMLPLPGVWMPVDGPIKVGSMEVLVSAGLFSAVLSAMLLCKSRLVFARTWAMLLFAAGGFAILGLVQTVTKTDNILWLIPTANSQFFSTFPHPAHWSAFALLWISAGFGLMAWLVRQRGWRWIEGEGWVILAAVIVLALSIGSTGDPLHLLLAMLIGAVGSLVIAWQTRAERLRAKHSGVSLAVLAWAGAGVLLGGGAMLMAARHPLEEWVNYSGGLALHERIIEDTQTLWRQRPWFGWGAGTFRVAYSFFQGTDQSPLYVGYARSDFWQSLAEHGLIGTAAWCVPAVWVLGRLLWQRRLATFLITPLLGLAAIIVLAVVDFPFASPAVFFSFWLLLMSLGRWSQVDKEDKASNPSEKRKMEALRAKGQTLPPKNPGALPNPVA